MKNRNNVFFIYELLFDIYGQQNHYVMHKMYILYLEKV